MILKPIFTYFAGIWQKLGQHYLSDPEMVAERYAENIHDINALRDTLSSQDDDTFFQEVQEKSAIWRATLTETDENDTDENDMGLRNEILAYACETIRRKLNINPYDVQLQAALSLDDGRMCDQGTGEGKTVVGVLAAVLNAYAGKGVHIATVNDYLVQRDIEEMHPVYTGMGLSVGMIVSDMPPRNRAQAYNCDVTYGTISQFGFDYLKTRLNYGNDDPVQPREPNFLILDEADQILIDDGTTPLIISNRHGGVEADEERNIIFANDIIKTIRQKASSENEDEKYFDVDLQSRQVTLTDEGQNLFEEIYRASLPDDQNSDENFDINSMNDFLSVYIKPALMAHFLFDRNKDYAVLPQDDGVTDSIVLIDKQTKRKMPGRSYNNGLQQALQAKENVKILAETEQQDKISIQYYCSKYRNVVGMSGSMAEAAKEIYEVFGVETNVIGRNKPSAVLECDDKFVLDQSTQIDTLKTQIIEDLKAGRPVLVGAADDATAKAIFEIIKNDDDILTIISENDYPKPDILCIDTTHRETEIVENAGLPGAITISTPMAGRGTDIKLGGKDRSAYDQVCDAGGLSLYVFGTLDTRSEKQLRGRCGRQGEPGRTMAIRSCDDGLFIRMNLRDRMIGLLKRLGMDKDEVIDDPMITKSMRYALKRAENFDMDARVHTIKYGNVEGENDDRFMKMAQRVFESDFDMEDCEDLQDYMFLIFENLVSDIITRHFPQDGRSIFDDEIDGVLEEVNALTRFQIHKNDIMSDEDRLTREDLFDRILDVADEIWKERHEVVTGFDMQINPRQRSFVIEQIQRARLEYGNAMTFLRESRGMEQMNSEFRDHMSFFQFQAKILFDKQLDKLRHSIVRGILVGYDISIRQQKAMAETSIVAAQRMAEDLGRVLDRDGPRKTHSDSIQQEAVTDPLQPA